MKEKHVKAYMDTAKIWAKCSSATRLQVGAVVVKDHQILSTGYNGMPNGWDNTCEYKDYCISRDINGNYFPGTENIYPFEDIDETGKYLGRYRMKTKPEVLHAESNALMKIAKNNGGANNASLFCTHSPCLECAKLIYQAGISEVYYENEYRSDEGINFLKKTHIIVHKI